MAVLRRILLVIVFSAPLFACAQNTAGISKQQTQSTEVPKELEARISKLEDIQEIKNLQAQYSYLIDTGQMDALADIFADDFVWEGGSDAASMNSVSSKPELLKLLNGAAQATTMMRHEASTPHIEVHGDTAKGTWYVFGMLTAVTPDGEEAKWVQGRLDNEYVKINGQWKISRKSTTYNFSTPYEQSWANAKQSANPISEGDSPTK